MLKVTFLLSYFCMTKSTKSQQGGLTPSSFRTSVRRARVSRASRAWRVRAANGKAKIGGFALSMASAIPRVRTYHTKKPSRFVHALPARPLDNGWRGRESNMCADGTKQEALLTPHPSAYGCHLLPLEKAGEMLIFSKQKGARVKDNHFSNGTAQNSVAVCADGFGKPSPVGEGGAVYRDG